MQATSSPVFVGTAGWTIPAHAKGRFPAEGSHLFRYSRVFNAVEINSAFYRDHKPETYLKWADAVPNGFRFAVKLSRYFTQEARLKEGGKRLAEVLAGIGQLGEKFGVLLIQLPPSLDFHHRTAREFFREVRKYHRGPVALEPRHLSWSSNEALRLLLEFGIAKVMADPERCPLRDTEPSPAIQQANLLYCRLHGSPEIYKSRYSNESIHEVAGVLSEASRLSNAAWCIFDNTTFGYATENALELIAMKAA